MHSDVAGINGTRDPDAIEELEMTSLSSSSVSDEDDVEVLYDAGSRMNSIDGGAGEAIEMKAVRRSTDGGGRKRRSVSFEVQRPRDKGKAKMSESTNTSQSPKLLESEASKKRILETSSQKLHLDSSPSSSTSTNHKRQPLKATMSPNAPEISITIPKTIPPIPSTHIIHSPISPVSISAPALPTVLSNSAQYQSGRFSEDASAKIQSASNGVYHPQPSPSATSHAHKQTHAYPPLHPNTSVLTMSSPPLQPVSTSTSAHVQHSISPEAIQQATKRLQAELQHLAAALNSLPLSEPTSPTYSPESLSTRSSFENSKALQMQNHQLGIQKNAVERCQRALEEILRATS
jgi:hypothetical protein